MVKVLKLEKPKKVRMKQRQKQKQSQNVTVNINKPTRMKKESIEKKPREPIKAPPPQSFSFSPIFNPSQLSHQIKPDNKISEILRQKGNESSKEDEIAKLKTEIARLKVPPESVQLLRSEEDYKVLPEVQRSRFVADNGDNVLIATKGSNPDGVSDFYSSKPEEYRLLGSSDSVVSSITDPVEERFNPLRPSVAPASDEFQPFQSFDVGSYVPESILDQSDQPNVLASVLEDQVLTQAQAEQSTLPSVGEEAYVSTKASDILPQQQVTSILDQVPKPTQEQELSGGGGKAQTVGYVDPLEGVLPVAEQAQAIQTTPLVQLQQIARDNGLQVSESYTTKKGGKQSTRYFSKAELLGFIREYDAQLYDSLPPTLKTEKAKTGPRPKAQVAGQVV